MAARTKYLFHPDHVRAKIKSSMLINRLTDHANSPKPLMDSSQVAAANILLRKVLPDLSATTLSGSPDHPIRHSIEVKFVMAQPATDAGKAYTYFDKVNG